MNKRYTLGIKEKDMFITLDELTFEQIQNGITEYNNKQNSEYLISEPYKSSNNEVKITLYKKISKPNKLNTLDSFTLKYKDEETIKKSYNISNKNEIVIMYKYNGLRLLPTFYAEDEKYIHELYLREKIIEYAGDIDFLSMLLENELVRKTIGTQKGYLEKLQVLREKLKSNEEHISCVDTIIFYNAFIKGKDKKKVINYYNYRILANIVREFEKLRKKESTEGVEQPKEKTTYEQPTFEEVVKRNEELETLKKAREIYESIKAGEVFDREDPEYYKK